MERNKQIIKMFGEGVSQADIARKFKITPQRVNDLIKKFGEQDIKKLWYEKGWHACVKEFEWRLKFLFEKDERWWRILEIIEKLRK